jgi:hypothetical protein
MAREKQTARKSTGGQPPAKKARTDIGVSAAANAAAAAPVAAVVAAPAPAATAADLAAFSFSQRDAEAKVSALKSDHKRHLLALADRQKREMAACLAGIALARTAAAAAKGAAQCQLPCKKCKEDVNPGAFFVCSRCVAIECNTHKTGMTTCTECSKQYCGACSKAIPVCAGCALCPQLTCCDLQKMPCGEYESNDCVTSHHKHCSCR